MNNSFDRLSKSLSPFTRRPAALKSFLTVLLFSLGAPWSLLADPIVVRIHDLGYPQSPRVEVEGAPYGWNFHPGADLGIVDPSHEDGGVITLFGVDPFGSLDEPGECGWRFVDPGILQPVCFSAVDIIWIQHDYFGPFYNGDLQIAFNSAFPGSYYENPDVCASRCPDASLGPLTYKWQLVYADSTVVVLFKAQKKSDRAPSQEQEDRAE